MPFRHGYRLVSLGALLVVALSGGRAPIAPVAPAAAPMECPERGSCPRCPAPQRRAPETCATCPQATLAVTSRRVRLERPEALAPERDGRGHGPSTRVLATRHAALRGAVLAASPPAHLLLSTLRN